jgi:hypothetical protein
MSATRRPVSSGSVSSGDDLSVLDRFEDVNSKALTLQEFWSPKRCFEVTKTSVTDGKPAFLRRERIGPRIE